MDCQATGCDKTGSLVELIFAETGLSLCINHFQESKTGQDLQDKLDSDSRQARAKTMGTRMWSDLAQSEAEDKEIERINKDWEQKGQKDGQSD